MKIQHLTIVFIALCLFTAPIFADNDPILTVKDFSNYANGEWNVGEKGISLVQEKEGVIETAPVSADSTFNAGFVSWKSTSDEGLTIRVRVSKDGESWTQWSEPCKREMEISWKEAYNLMQFQVTFAQGCQAVLSEVNFMYTFNNVNFNEMTQRIAKANELFQINNRSVTALGKPYVVSRSGWGARPPKGSYSSHRPNKITLHHSWRPSRTQFKGSSTIRGIQRYHMDSNGWSDVGYHFLIGTDSSGNVTIYQGRPENKIGAHTGGYNTHNIGICLIGDHDVESLHPNAYKKLVELIAWLCATYRISPDNLYGHRDFSTKTCPGGIVYGQFSKIKRDVRSKIGW